MVSKYRSIIALLVLVVLCAMACKSDSASAAEKAREAQDEALQKLEKSMESLKGGSGEVVDFRILKDALPEKIVGMQRSSHNGQKSGMGGFKVSSAEATYEDGDKKMSISIIDTGGLGLALAAMAGWSNIEIDNESDDGYERTTLIDGKKAFEKYNRKTRHGEIAVISADRFIVTIDGNNISEADLRTAISKIKVKG